MRKITRLVHKYRLGLGNARRVEGQEQVSCRKTPNLQGQRLTALTHSKQEASRGEF